MKIEMCEILKPAIAFIIGFSIANLFLSVFVINIEPVYTSNVTIDQYGANYTSARWEYHIQPERKYIWDTSKESWAYFDMDIRNIEEDFNLSDCKGVSFYIKGNIENQLIEFNLFTHNFTQDNKVYNVYQYWNKGNLLVTTNWRREKILFSTLSATPWTEKRYPEAPESPNLEKVCAFGFAIKKTVEPTENKIWIDEMYFLHKNKSKTLISTFNALNTSTNGKEGLWHAGWGHL